MIETICYLLICIAVVPIIVELYKIAATYVREMIIFLHGMLLVGGLIFYGYGVAIGYRYLYPTPQDQVAQVIVDRALKNWEGK